MDNVDISKELIKVFDDLLDLCEDNRFISLSDYYFEITYSTEEPIYNSLPSISLIHTVNDKNTKEYTITSNKLHKYKTYKIDESEYIRLTNRFNEKRSIINDIENDKSLIKIKTDIEKLKTKHKEN